MRCRPLFNAFTAILLTVPCRATVVYVKQNAPGPIYDGSSWDTAYGVVTAGLNAAVSGDEVWVAAGTYRENLTLKSGVGLYGGFMGTETGRSQRNPSANVTTLDGQGKATVVIIAADANSATVLDGFTIYNGYGPVVDGSGRAGGVFVKGGTPVVSNNVITGCAAAGGTTTSAGGGIYVAAASPLIAGNTITNNHAMFGGGIYALGGLIRDNVIAYNWASNAYLGYGAGGGIRAFNAVIVHNRIQDNDAPDPNGGGGGISGYANAVMGNVFLDNAGSSGAAIHCGGVCTVTRNAVIDLANPYGSVGSEVWFTGGVFANNVIATRSAYVGMSYGLLGRGNDFGTQPRTSNNDIVHVGPGGLLAVEAYYYSGERPVFSNNIVTGWDNLAYASQENNPPVFTTDHNNLYGNADNTLALPGASQIGANGNISQDPLFVDAANGNYRLQAGSSCIDAGNDAYVATGDRDAEGRPRIAGAHVDIGAYEYGSPLYTMLDAAEVLRISAGLTISTPANVSRLNVVPESPGLTVTDATRIAQWLLG